MDTGQFLLFLRLFGSFVGHSTICEIVSTLFTVTVNILDYGFVMVKKKASSLGVLVVHNCALSVHDRNSLFWSRLHQYCPQHAPANRTISLYRNNLRVMCSKAGGKGMVCGMSCVHTTNQAHEPVQTMDPECPNRWG